MSQLAETRLEPELLQPFVNSTKAVFSSMLEVAVTVRSFGDCFSDNTSYDISGIIGFSGGMSGTMVIRMEKAVACGAAQALGVSESNEIDADICDLVGELANMIGGSAKEQIDIEGISLGLPTVVVGNVQQIVFDHDTQVHGICFSTQWGSICVDIGLRLPVE